MTATRSREGRQASTLMDVLVVVATVALLATVVLPMLAPRRKGTPRRISCFVNLKQVGLGFRLWASDHEERYPWIVPVAEGGSLEYVGTAEVFRHFQAASNEFNSPKILACLGDRSRLRTNLFETNFSNVNLSYFAGLSASVTNPSSILAGDRNLTTNGIEVKTAWLTLPNTVPLGWTPAIHTNAGNIALADGSVVQLSNPMLGKVVKATGLPTNSFAIPIVP